MLYKKVFGHLIPPNLKITDNILICCPFHNDRTPSLSISTDPNKPVFKCFGCPAKGSLIDAYMMLNNVNFKQAVKELDLKQEQIYIPTERKSKIKKMEYLDYSDEVIKYINNLHDNYKIYGKKFYDLTGLTMSTQIGCAIGVTELGNWIFPILMYPNDKIIGYEVRKSDFTKFIYKNGEEAKCLKAPKSPSCLAYINKGDNKKVIIMEGFKDAYFMYQHLKAKNPKEQVKETILTPTMGVATLPDLLQENKLEEFEEIVIIVDNDEAGNKVKDILKTINPKFKFFNGLLEKEDFEMYYKRINKKE